MNAFSRDVNQARTVGKHFYVMAKQQLSDLAGSLSSGISLFALCLLSQFDRSSTERSMMQHAPNANKHTCKAFLPPKPFHPVNTYLDYKK